MNLLRAKIRQNLCYTDLVYARINKKLNQSLTHKEIEHLVQTIVTCETNSICSIGKNYYITDNCKKIRITINANTFRVITADKLRKVGDT